MICFINAKLYDYEKYIESGYIIFDDCIKEVGPMEEWDNRCDAIDLKGQLLMPGLINCHTHIYSTLFRGLDLGVSPKDFKSVLDDIWWRFDKELTLKDIEYSAKVYGLESFKNGVTALIDHHASGEIVHSIFTLDQALNEIGMKHLLCFETSDRFDVSACIAENRMALDLGGHFGLHASLSLSDETLKCVKESLGSNPIHIHVAEAIDDEIDSLENHGMRVVSRLDKFDLLNEESILAHCIHIDDKEAALIEDKGCYVALNTTSNMNNAVGIYNYKRLKKYRIPVIVGTDGLGTNVAKEYQNLFYLGKLGLNDPTGVDFMWIKEIIQNGYGYFSKKTGRKIGRFEEGYVSDLIVIDYKPPTPMNADNALGHVFYSVFDQIRPRHVIASGEWKVKDYDLVNDFELNEDLCNELWMKVRRG